MPLMKWTVKKVTGPVGGYEWQVWSPHKVYDKHWSAGFHTQEEAFQYAYERAEKAVRELLKV
jgi:hypothetical protein